MNATDLIVGARVLVAMPEDALFIAQGHYKGQGINQFTGRHDARPMFRFEVVSAWPGRRAEFTPPDWVNDAPKPWYPHGQVVEVVEVVEQFYARVRDGGGRTWAAPIGCWALTEIGHGADEQGYTVVEE